MDLIRTVIGRPVSVAVGVILLVMFGLIGLTAIPIQLVPDVDRPIVTVTTSWPGRSPQEVIDEITKEQEEVLKNVSNLKTMTSVSTEANAEITLEFYLGASIDRALQEVSDALRRVPSYPDDVNEPVIKAAEGAAENAIAWIILDVDPAHRGDHPDFDIATLFDPMDREVKPYLERVDGVAEVNIYGGVEREMHVLLDADKLAQRGLSHDEVLAALAAANRNVSAGSVDEGKREWRVRVLGQFESLEQIEETVITWREAGPIRVRDLGRVELGYQKKVGFVRSFGTPVLAMNIIRQSGANVLDLMTDVRGRLDEVRRDLLPRLDPEVGKHLRLRQVYDETVYLDSAIHLVQQNLWVGGLLAGLVLLLFLRSLPATGIIAFAIPLSVIGTFLVMLTAGRTLNVISLAGLAFAVGMVVDNAIVVLENVFRRQQLGDPPLLAAYRGAKEVWGAVLASTLTTMAVFVPILTIQEEAGQLFRDISLAIVAAVGLSLIVSVTVIPAACSRLLGDPNQGRLHRLLGGLDRGGALVVDFVGGVVRGLISGRRAHVVRPAVIAVMTLASVIGAALLAPPLDYLPAGNRNLVFGGLLIPPGYSMEQRVSIAERIEDVILPFANADITDPASLASLPPVQRFSAPNDPFAPVPIENFFIGGFGTFFFVGATSQDDEVVIPVGQVLTNAMSVIPDAFGGARQSSIFGRGAAGNSIDLEISGPDLARVEAAAQMMLGVAGAKYGYANVRPNPANFNLAQPEWRLEVTDTGRQLGVTSSQLGTATRALVDGVKAGEVPQGGRNIDLIVMPLEGRVTTRQDLPDRPIATPSGRSVPLSLVAQFRTALAPQSIQRIEELPAVTLSITPPEGEPLSQVIGALRADVVAPAEQAGLLDATMRVRLEGTAAKLDEVSASLFGQRHVRGLEEWWQVILAAAAGLVGLAGLIAAARHVGRSLRGAGGFALYGAAAALIVAGLLASLLLGLAFAPHLIMARFVWALAVTYLLMAALFESFTYPLVIMFSVPFAVVGGFAGLWVVHRWTSADPTVAPQQLDVLTMLGFVILIGVVVNNAILLVHQALNFMRGTELEGAEAEALPPVEAIVASVRTRIRPIFMSTLTSIGGMLPLVLFPGAGSEMYRGLGSVVIGGLLVSTVFTLLLVPLVFSLLLDFEHGLRGSGGADSDASRAEELRRELEAELDGPAAPA